MATAEASSPRRRHVPPAPARSDGAALPVRHRGLLTVGVMLATIIQILDTTIANVALPHMTTSLGATRDTLTWVLTSYLVASAIAMPITGWLADRLGSRNLFLLALIGFMLSSALCGMAQNLPEMVLFRVIQGISAAFMNPLSQTVLLDINPPERQPRAMSIWAMGIMIGPIMGPVLGGWLTDNFNWRWVFYVNLPLGMICLAILYWLLPSRPVRRRGFDLFGFSLLALGLAALQLMLDRGQGEDWFQSFEVQLEALIAFVGLWMFVAHMATAKRPMFDRELFRDRNLVTALLFLAILGVVMMATMALLPPMLESIYGHSVLDTGLLLTPRGTGVIVTTAISGYLMQRGFDPRWLVASGFAIAAYSMWTMTGWALDMETGPILIAGFVQGLGMGLAFTPLNTLAFGTLPGHYRTEAASLMNVSRSVGASIGISAVTTVLARTGQIAHADLAPHISAETLDGLDPNLLRALGGHGEAALTMANAEITRQAAMIGYLNDFQLMAILTACAVPLVLLMRKPARAGAKPDPSAAGH